MAVELKQRALAAVLLLLLAGWGCDGNTTAPTRAKVSYSPVTTNNGGTFAGSSGLPLSCTIDNGVPASQGPIPPMSNPIPPLDNPIPLLVSSTQSAAAIAIDSPPSIFINPGLLLSLLPPVRAFVFFRECARFNMPRHAGSAFFDGTTCWSVRRLQQMNLFGPSERTAIQRFLELTFPFATPSVPSGAHQWATIATCL
jgi:hypothetical protein